MRMYDLILKKKQGKELNTEEINWMIKEFTEGRIPDYQMSAMTMAICFQGMDKRETFDLTMAMRDSGDVLDLSRIDGIKVDKHSTGGVGDKVSLVLTPIVASLGVPVAKMSGRGLGHTGGTIDKLESFSGFSTEISEEKFIDSVNTIGIAIAGQTANLAPADKKLYALRDVTATVDQMSLIASSIMSKKLASGADAIVLDVKTGNGAFMQKEEDAIALAKAMVDIGNRAGKQTVAVITDMDEPLGNAVGNALEIKEVIDRGVPQPKILVSDRVQVVMPYHILFDQYEEERLGKKSFGSTKSGIAPFYSDKFAKIGFELCEFYDSDDEIKEKIEHVLVQKNALLRDLYHKPELTVDEIFEKICVWREEMRPYMADTFTFLHQAIKEKKTILLEGQLGALKDPDFGIYPMVTSSSTLAGYGSVGAGIPPYEIKEIVTVVKAYSSAVGAGEFVSEIFGDEADELRRRGGDGGE